MSGPDAEDIQRSFAGRVFGVVGHPPTAEGWGGGRGALHNLSLSFVVDGEQVDVETSTDPPGDDSPLARLALKALILPPKRSLPLTLTFEDRTPIIRVCGHEKHFRSYVCGDRAIAWARFGDLWVTVESPTAFLDGRFELDDQASIPSLS